MMLNEILHALQHWSPDTNGPTQIEYHRARRAAVERFVELGEWMQERQKKTKRPTRVERILMDILEGKPT